MRPLAAAFRSARGGLRGLSAGGALAAASLNDGGAAAPPSVRRAAVARCEGPSSTWSGFKPAFRGQVTPLRSLPVQPVAGSPAVELQGGPFGSRWLRVRHGADAAEVLKHLDEAEVGANSAVWIGVPDDYADSPRVAAALRGRGYKFHHAMEGGGDKTTPANELCYYRWFGGGADMVPDYTTAHEGVGALVLSPERDAVLLVWEYGNWKMITGNLDGCDSVASTVTREVREECGLELEDDMLMVGGWQDPKAYDGRRNNVFWIFVATAKSRDVRVDGKEIAFARWFTLASLPSLQAVLEAPQVKGKPYSLKWDTGDAVRDHVSRVVPPFLATWQEGRGLTCHNSLAGILYQSSRTVFR